MFNNVNSNPNLLRGHINNRPKSESTEAIEKQESLILKNLVNQKTNPDQESPKKNYNKHNHSSLDEEKSQTASIKEDAPPIKKDFIRLLNVI